MILLLLRNRGFFWYTSGECHVNFGVHPPQFICIFYYIFHGIIFVSSYHSRPLKPVLQLLQTLASGILLRIAYPANITVGISKCVRARALPPHPHEGDRDSFRFPKGSTSTPPLEWYCILVALHFHNNSITSPFSWPCPFLLQYRKFTQGKSCVR